MKRIKVDCEEVGDPFGRRGIQMQQIACYHFVFKMTENLKILEISCFFNLWESLEEYLICKYYSNFETCSRTLTVVHRNTKIDISIILAPWPWSALVCLFSFLIRQQKLPFIFKINWYSLLLQMFCSYGIILIAIYIVLLSFNVS